MTSHLPVLRHLSPAPSRSRYLGLDHSHSELMRFLLWPFCLLNVQALSFPFALNVVHSTPYSQVRHLQRMDPSSGSPSLSFPGGHLTFLPRGPGNIFPRCQGVISVLCTILWAKNHCRLHGRLGLKEARVKQRPAPAAASLKNLLSKGCLTRSNHLRRPLSPWGSRRALEQLSQRPQFRLCWDF